MKNWKKVNKLKSNKIKKMIKKKELLKKMIKHIRFNPSLISSINQKQNKAL